MDFNQLWNNIVNRSREQAIPIVQDKVELEYVFNLLRGCASYLEVGTAEGNSLYVLAHAMPKGSEIYYIDWAEKHTQLPRQWALDIIGQVEGIHGDSNDFHTMAQVRDKRFDAVVIDAGHDDFNVAIDALFYGALARKYIIFHDIQMPDVLRAFEWYARQRPDCKCYRVINSETYGYGILEIV